MQVAHLLALLVLLLSSGTEILAQKVSAPKVQAGPGFDTTPVLRLEAGGPTAHVTALGFSPNGKTLYAAGFDKVVRVWNLDEQSGRFALDPFAYRVPISAGTVGVINSLAISPDGDWIAVSGLGMFRTAARSFEPGRVFYYDPPRSSEMRQERATIHLFHTKTHAESVLRGHAGRVLRMAFAPVYPNKPPLLVSAAEEPDQAGTLVGRVCLWDVSKAASLDDKGELVDRGALLDEWTLGQHPKQDVGLAIRHTGPGPRQLHVAIAWNDGKLRMWETAQHGPTRVREVPDGQTNLNNTVAYLSSSEFLTGAAVNEEGGYLQWWKDLPSTSPQRGTKVPLRAPEGYHSILPRALSLLSSRPGSGLSHAAVAARFFKPKEESSEFGLVLVDLATLRPVTTVALWRGQYNPVLASASTGEYLAVAGDQDHSIWVYSVQDLLRGRKPQRLQSVGLTIRSVAFVQKNQGQDLGLLLSATAGSQPGGSPRLAKDDLVFEFAKRSLTADPRQQAWTVSGPALDGWRVKGAPLPLASARQDKNIPWRVEWEGPNTGGQLTLQLPATEKITNDTLLPPSPFCPVPTLAIATWDASIGQTLIRLYHAKTGEWLRQFREHTLRIRSLAGSRDGRFLVSASEDQTVCIWTLKDLDKAIGQQGSLAGVFVQKQGNHLVVKRVDQGSPARGKLEVDDVLMAFGVKDGAKPRILAAVPLDYYNALWEMKPGTTVTFQIERQGVQRKVDVVIGQGVEDHRPLLSLFVPADQTQPRAWIAWTPLGPYDASGKDAERYLGWHFNPSKLEEPPRFARADAYHDTFYKPQLLKPLLAYGDIHQTLSEIDKPPPVPKPDLDLQVDSPGPDLTQKDDQGQVLVRDLDLTLQLTVIGPSLDKGQVQEITWRLDNGPPQALNLTKASGQRLLAKIRLAPLTVRTPSAGGRSKVAGARGVHMVQVQLRTHEDQPQVAVRELELRYQPPPPAIVFDEAWFKQHFGKGSELRQIVQEARFTVPAQVRPGLAGQEVKVSLRHNKAKPLPLGLRVEQSLDLQPGENVIVLQAENQDALAGYEKFERDQKTLVLDFQRKPRPEILLRTVEPLAPPVESVLIQPGKAILVRHAGVRVRGTVKAAEPLKRFDVKDAEGNVLAELRPASQELVLDQNLRLKPGEQIFRFRAETANTEPTEVHLTLAYQPPLPELELTDPPVEDLSLIKGRDEPEINVKARFSVTDELVPFEVVVTVTNHGKTVPQANGKDQIVVPFRTVQDGETQTLAKVRLAQGSNRIRVLVKNAWSEGSPRERHISFLRPPRILTLKSSPPDKKPFTDLMARVETPTDLPPTRISIDGLEYAKVVTRPSERSLELTTWEIRAEEVPLHKGGNSLRFAVYNQDGRCLEERSVDVSYMAEPAKIATVRIVKPQEALLDPEYELQFRAESFTRLKSVELRQGNQTLQSIDVRSQEEVDGQFVLKKSVPLRLKEGTNQFRIVVVNEGGPAHDDVAVSFVQPAVRVIVAALPAQEVPGPKLTITGHIAFRDAKEALRNDQKAQRIRVYVNGFQQRPPEIQPAQVLKTLPFSAEVLLNRHENQIEIECPDLPMEAGRKQQFTVSCARPQPPATLHLMIVGMDVKAKEQRDKLVEHAFTALRTNREEEGLRSAVFNRVLMHPYSAERTVQLLAGYIPQGVVASELRKLEYFIAKRGSPSDVVLIYWLGRDLVQENGEWYLPTSESRPRSTMSDTGIALRKILGMDGDVAGARVLLLDVTSAMPPGGQPAVEMPAKHVAMLRYEWSKQEVPLPGLLVALETAASPGKRISLGDMLAAADKYRANYANAPRLTHNLPTSSPLAGLILSQGQ